MRALFQGIFLLCLISLLGKGLFANGDGVLYCQEKELSSIRNHFQHTGLPVVEFLTTGKHMEQRNFTPREEAQVLEELLQERNQRFLRKMVPYGIYPLAKSLEKKGLVLFMEKRKSSINGHLGQGAYEFLTSSIKDYQEFLKASQETEKSILTRLLHRNKRRFLNTFISITTDEPALPSAIQEGRLGLALCVRALHQNRKEAATYDALLQKGVFNYGYTHGYDDFFRHVTETNVFEFSKTSRGLSLSWSLLGDLKQGKTDTLEEFFSQDSFRPKKPLKFTEQLSTLLYLEAARLQHQPLMEFLLTTPETTKPSQELENHVLHASLTKYAAPSFFIEWLTTAKPGLRGDMSILETILLESAQKWLSRYALPNWDFIYSLKSVFKERKHFIDALYSMAAAYGNDSIMEDIESSLGHPSLEGEDSAFVNSAANGRVSILRKLSRNNPSQAILDRALEHTVTHNQKEAFDFLLDELHVHLPSFPFLDETTILFSRETLKKCSEITPKSRNSLDFSFSFSENHFQKRLREKFGIGSFSLFSPARTSLAELSSLPSSLNLSSFTLPSLNIDNILVKLRPEELFVPSAAEQKEPEDQAPQ